MAEKKTNQQNQHQKDKKDQKSTNAVRRVAFIIAVILLSIAAASLLVPNRELKEVPLSEVIAEANKENGDIKKITVSGSDIEITMKDKDYPTEKSRKDSSGTLYEQGLINHCADLSGEELSNCQSKYPIVEFKESANDC